MTREELLKRVKEVGTWHYCHEFPFGIMTGTCVKEAVSPKLMRLLAAGAFSKPVYSNVLDLGANSGLISMWFCDNRRSQVVAVEAGEKYYAQLELAVEAKGYMGWIEPVFVDAHKFEMGKYDLILHLGLLHHMAKYKHRPVFRACREALLPGGEIVVQTKSDLPVPKLLRGFDDIRELYTYRGKTAWMATRNS